MLLPVLWPHSRQIRRSGLRCIHTVTVVFPSPHKQLMKRLVFRVVLNRFKTINYVSKPWTMNKSTIVSTLPFQKMLILVQSVNITNSVPQLSLPPQSLCSVQVVGNPIRYRCGFGSVSAFPFVLEKSVKGIRLYQVWGTNPISHVPIFSHTPLMGGGGTQGYELIWK